MTGPTDDITAEYIGDRPIHNDVVQLVEYQSIWPEQFQREAGRIQGALGSRALSIDHVGSTSVPGWLPSRSSTLPSRSWARPTRQRMFLTSRLPAISCACVSQAGLNTDCSKVLTCDVNIHVFGRDCVEVERMIVFRDLLRNNEGDRHLYEHTKRELASRRWKYVQHYADAKTEVITTILNRSEIGNDRRSLRIAHIDGGSWSTAQYPIRSVNPPSTTMFCP